MKPLKPLAIKNVEPYIVSVPYRIDIAVKALQAKFAELDWLEKSFARAVIRSRKENDQDYIFPGIFVSEGYDHLDMLQLDNYNAYSFFLSTGAETVEQYQEDIENTFVRNLTSIFWMNLERIGLSGEPNSFCESKKQEIIDKIKSTKFAVGGDNVNVLGVELISIDDNPTNIFDGFTLDRIEAQLLEFPYYGLKIEMKVVYNEGCL